MSKFITLLTIILGMAVSSCTTTEMYVVLPRNYLNMPKRQRLDYVAALYEVNQKNYIFATNNNRITRLKVITIYGD